MDVLDAEVERLRVAIDAVVPADEFPSAAQAGGLRFWSLITGSERPDWADRVIAVLDLLDRRSGGRFRRPGCRRPLSGPGRSGRGPRLRLVRSNGERRVLC
jgi:hypothetical protein